MFDFDVGGWRGGEGAAARIGELRSNLSMLRMHYIKEKDRQRLKE